VSTLKEPRENRGDETVVLAARQFCLSIARPPGGKLPQFPVVLKPAVVKESRWSSRI
jgi:hypothetical protein